MEKQLLLMVRDGVQSASLKLNPPELGWIEIKVSIVQDQASVHFHSANIHVRDALEAALPRLREQFQEQGLQLTQSDVSSQQQRDRQTQDQTARNFSQQQQGDFTADLTPLMDTDEISVDMTTMPNLFDAYA